MKLKTIILSLLVFAFVATTAHAQTEPIKSRHQATHKVSKSTKSDTTIARKRAFYKKRKAKQTALKGERINTNNQAMKLKKRRALKSRKQGTRKATINRSTTQSRTH